jgi:hypothetical protein
MENEVRQSGANVDWKEKIRFRGTEQNRAVQWAFSERYIAGRGGVTRRFECVIFTQFSCGLEWHNASLEREARQQHCTADGEVRQPQIVRFMVRFFCDLERYTAERFRRSSGVKGNSLDSSFKANFYSATCAGSGAAEY